MGVGGREGYNGSWWKRGLQWELEEERVIMGVGGREGCNGSWWKRGI